MHMTEICLGGNWVCAWNGPWRFPGKFLSRIRAGRCGGVTGWKFTDGPRLGNLDGPMVRKWNGKELGARDRGFLGNFQSDPSSAMWKDMRLET